MLNIRKYQDAIAIARKSLADALYVLNSGANFWPPSGPTDIERTEKSTIIDAISLVDTLEGWDMLPMTALTYRVSVREALGWALHPDMTMAQRLERKAGEEMKADVVLGEGWLVEKVLVEDDEFVVQLVSGPREG